MPSDELCEDIDRLAHAIVEGDASLSGVTQYYPNYSVATALEVYRNNYRGNLHDALAGVYPVIEQLVGNAFFRRLTRGYIEQHRSHSGNLHRYGQYMAHFIKDFDPTRELIYLPDVAALEWTCHCAYYAEDAANLEIKKLSPLDPSRYPSLVLRTHPACYVVRSAYPIAAIWQAHQPGATGDFHISFDDGSCIALVTRQNDVVRVCQLNEADAAWLSSVCAGAALGDATTATLASYPAFDLQACLANFLSRGVFTDFELRGAE